jgi:DnaK suppressor protein
MDPEGARTAGRATFLGGRSPAAADRPPRSTQRHLAAPQLRLFFRQISRAARDRGPFSTALAVPHSQLQRRGGALAPQVPYSCRIGASACTTVHRPQPRTSQRVGKAMSKSEGQGSQDAVDEATGLRPSERAKLKQRLLDERAAVIARIQQQHSAALEGDTQLPDEMDQANRDQDLGHLLRLADKQQELLAELDHALTKFDDDSYGLCEGTGEPIGVGRLTARPWARYSVAYKEQLEHEERQHGR